VAYPQKIGEWNTHRQEATDKVAIREICSRKHSTRRRLPKARRRGGLPEAAALSTDELEAVLLKIITRTMRILRRLGALIEEPDQTYLAETNTDGALRALQPASCTYRIALGPRAG
jgi:hypothetical protein